MQVMLSASIKAACMECFPCTKYRIMGIFMGFLGILIQVTWVAVMLSELAAAAVAFPISLPNCPDKCGDVEIPYPFGLRKGCSIDQNFLINCTNSFGPTQPILGKVCRSEEHTSELQSP